MGVLLLGLAAAGDAAPGDGGIPPLRVFTARDTGVKTMAWSAAQDPAGTLYFGCDSVVSFDGDRWRSEDMDPTYALRGIDVGPNGRIWAAGVNQIGWFEPGAQGRLAYHSLMPFLPDGDLGDVWRVYAEGNEGAVFVAQGRVLRWDGRRFKSWDFPGMHLLWSTRTAKALYVHYPPVGLLRIGEGGPSVAVAASVIGPADVRWLDDSGEDWLILTSEGFSTLSHGKLAAQVSEASAFVRANTPTSVAQLGDGSLAVGTLLGGIAIVDRAGRVLRVLNRQAGLPADQVYSVFADRDGAIWGMGPSHIVRIAIGSGVAVYGPQSGYPPGGCESVVGYEGTTFIASHSDLLRLDPDTGRFSTLGVTSNRFYSLLASPQGLVVGHVHGLGLWTPAGMKPLITSDDIVYRTGLSRAHPGILLASQSGAVLSVNLATGGFAVAAQSLPDYGDTLVDEPSGRLWIGTPTRGLFVAGPGTTRSVPASPRFGRLPTAGTTFVTRAGGTVVAIAKGAAFWLDRKSDRFLPVAGMPPGNPTVVSAPDEGGAVWAAFDPAPGRRTPSVGRISTGSEGATWTPVSVEGLAEIGSIVGLHPEPADGGDAVWIAGSEAMIRAGPGALSPRAPPPRPAVSAWIVRGDGVAERTQGGIFPYSTRRIHIEYSSLDFGMRSSERFQTTLGGAQGEWSPETDSAELDLSGLRDGRYDFQVRLISDSGVAGEPAGIRFEMSPPWWRTPSAYALFALAGAGALAGLLRARDDSLKRRAAALEQMVRQRTAELEKANAAKTEFVASMSHEIRNPMGGILGSALELSETPLEPGQRELVATLRSCATFLASLVEDVLDFAAIESGAYPIARSPFSPVEVLGAVRRMLDGKPGGARLEVAVDPALPARILGDAARIQQVIVNFAVNAFKFGGRRIVLSARLDGAGAVFSVADDGPGIPAEEQGNLFIRFSRLKSARNSAIAGTGLGLSVSRALAERMGGAVGVTSEPGRGSTFFLRVPMEPAAEPEPAQAGAAASGARALVVEDIDYNARALALMLGRLGYGVEIAADGERALDRAGAGRFDAVFIDCDLPGLGGIEVARALRGREAGGRRALIVATTAHSTVWDRQRCLAAGMDAFLAKPITPEKLRAALALPGGPAEGTPGREAPGEPGVELTLIRHLSDGSREGFQRELRRFVDSLDEAVLGLAAAGASGSRATLASAAHRVVSHARMVGASELAAVAEDLQEFSAAYSERELSEEIAVLRLRAAALRETLEGLLDSRPAAG